MSKNARKPVSKNDRKPVAAAVDEVTQRKLDAARAEFAKRKANASDAEPKPAAATVVEKSRVKSALGIPDDYTLGESAMLFLVGKRREDTWARISIANVAQFATTLGVAWLAPYIAFGLAMAAMTLTASLFFGLVVFYVACAIGIYYAWSFGKRAFHWIRSGQADFDMAMVGVRASVRVAQVTSFFSSKSDDEVIDAATAAA